MAKNKTDSSISFEDALSELEEIASSLSGGELALEESLELFERAAQLRKICAQRLDKAEKRVRILTEEAGGYREDDFNEG